MSRKPVVDLGGLVNASEPADTDPGPGRTLSPLSSLSLGGPTPQAAPKSKVVKLKKAGFLVHPAALKQFDVLRAELAGDDRKNAGVKLIAEALNLLFEKHGKPAVHLDI
ncbi:MAG: hypothetical protein ABJA98_24270 [Acidobacteriota bacterium]